MNHGTIDIRQTKIAAGVMIRKSSVIESQQLKNGRVQIMNVNRFLDRFETKLVRGTIGLAAPNASTG